MRRIDIALRLTPIATGMSTMAHFRDASSATSEKIADVIRSGREPVIQFDRPVEPAALCRVNDYCREFGSELQVRFFAWEWKPFDASILEMLPDAANLRLDTLRRIENWEILSNLPKLTRLGFGVYEHPDGSFLHALPLEQLSRLNLGKNERRNFDLSPLGRATRLEHLFVQSHHRGIDAIKVLPKLSDISLSGFPKQHGLAFLNDLAALRSLLLILGSRESIAEFAHGELRKLRIVWVRNLKELGPLARFGKLEALSIEDQRLLTRLDLTGLSLRRLHLANCKTLEGIDNLDQQACLEHFYFRDTRLPAEYRDYLR